jgi:TorA maturation chaperone TorD
LSYQLAQRDFAERHLISWIPRFAAQVESHAPGSLYARVVTALGDFLEEDFAWQTATIVLGGASDSSQPAK